MLYQYEPRENECQNTAKTLRALLKWRKEILAMAPWLPVPQASCCYTFGSGMKPLPVAALFILWDHWPAARGQCRICGGPVWAIGFGGLLSIGGVVGYCSECGREHFYEVTGGLTRIGREAGSFLEGTEYFISRAVFGGSVNGRRKPLWETLKGLGETNLPDEAWANGSQVSVVSMHKQIHSTSSVGELMPPLACALPKTDD
jgi:hypothetical protein